jgi:gliding motility-associated-like protein
LWNTNPTQISQTATGLSAGNYIVSLLDSNGCTNMIAATITEPPAISSTINSVNANCYGSNTGTAATAAAGGSPPYSYLWSNGQTTYSAINLAAGNYSVLITDHNGCSHIDAATVSQPSLLSAAITIMQNVSCNTMRNGSATANASGGTSSYHYQWSNGQATATATGLSAKDYSVTITDANGCSAIAAITITQPTAVAVSVNGEAIICPGQNASISVNASGGTNPYTYFWQPNVGFGNSQTVAPTSTTTYSAIVTDAHGCTTAGAVTISVYTMNIVLTANATPDICVGQSATIGAAVTGNNISYYYWSNNNLENGAGPYTVYPTTTTTYSVTVTNICGATATAAATIIVHPLPQITLAPQTAVACDRTILQFFDINSANNGSTYVWNFGDGYSSVQAHPFHTYLQSGSYVVDVTVTSPYGCSSSAQANCTVGVLPSPVANFTSDPLLATSIINPDFHFFDQSANANSWYWDFCDGQTSTLQNPMHTYAAKGIYTVKLVTMNAGTCIDSIIKTVEVKPEFTFYIPNTFTPNGDRDNETFTGKGLEIIEYNMIIFDRWGNEIFRTDDLNKGWDGRANGGTDIAQQDTYVYEVRLKDFTKKSHFYSGHVNLIK